MKKHPSNYVYATNDPISILAQEPWNNALKKVLSSGIPLIHLSLAT